jgi:hypothetical protein
MIMMIVIIIMGHEGVWGTGGGISGNGKGKRKIKRNRH